MAFILEFFTFLKLFKRFLGTFYNSKLFPAILKSRNNLRLSRAYYSLYELYLREIGGCAQTPVTYKLKKRTIKNENQKSKYSRY